MLKAPPSAAAGAVVIRFDEGNPSAVSVGERCAA